MNKEFNAIEFLELLNLIDKNYQLLKQDASSLQCYLNLKDSLKKLDYLIQNKLIPSDILFKTIKFYYDYYRLMETTYIKIKLK